MNVKNIDETMNKYVANGELSCAALVVTKGKDDVYKNTWGYSDLNDKIPVDDKSIYRLMSMTKCITAVAVMILIDEGKLSLDDAVSEYIPELKNLRVSVDERYVYRGQVNPLKLIWKVATFNPDKVKTVPANREITVRDLLSHSSGLQQGVVGFIQMLKDKKPRASMEEEAKKYAALPLGFQPGEGTGYSPIAGFDMLGLLIERVSGEKVGDFMKEKIFNPLGMKDTFFYPDTEEQNKRIVRVYKRKKDKLVDVTGGKDDMDSLLKRSNGYTACSGGLFSTAGDFDKFAKMLLWGGEYNGARILKEETVRLMTTEAPKKHLEPDPGCVWGLGMKIRQNPEKANSFATAGTYGWSGAFGTHFFISPKDNLAAVFMTNRTDLNGSGSYISKEIERLVFGCFGEENKNV